MTISSTDFQFLRTMVYRDSAIVLGEDQLYLLEARLAPLAVQAGVGTLTALVRLLQRQTDFNLRRQVVEAMTTNETSFFRDTSPFEVLKNDILPSLIQRRLGERRLRIWSGASSTGQESCSLAMTLMESHWDVASQWDVQIVGTDLCTPVVEKARSGIYTQREVSRGLPDAMLKKYFTPFNGMWKISPNIQKLQDFRIMNLAMPWSNLPRFDIIFLRNVLIYFDKETRQTIFNQLRSHLRPDGILFVGSAESLREIDTLFEVVRSGPTHYFRPKL